MHVLLVIDSLASGGAQRQLTELAVALHAIDGVCATVLVYYEADFFAARLHEAGVPLVRLRKPPGPDPRLALRMRGWLREHRPDVVHAFLLRPALWARLATWLLPRRTRPPVVASERDSVIAGTPGEARLQRFVYGRCEAATANAEPVARSIVERLGVAPERVHYLPNGIDLREWDRRAAEPCPFELEPGAFHVALIGGLRPQKNHALLFEALRRLGPERTAHWRVWCVGGHTMGEDAARAVHARAAGLEAVVRFVQPVRNVAALVSRLDAVVLPSLHEGFPNVLLEAMASRVPVVASPVGDVANLVADGEVGFVVPNDDPAPLAEALARLDAMGPEGRARLGAAGRRRVEERYPMEVVAGRYLALYRELGAGA